MIANNKFTFDLNSLEASAKLFCTKNRFDDILMKEMIYVCKAFGTFFNYCQNANDMYNIDQVLDLFNQNLTMQAVAFGNGLQTGASEFYMYVPQIRNVIEKLRKEALKAEFAKKEERLELKEQELKKEMERLKDLEKEAKQKMKEAEKYRGMYDDYCSRQGRC